MIYQSGSPTIPVQKEQLNPVDQSEISTLEYGSSAAESVPRIRILPTIPDPEHWFIAGIRYLGLLQDEVVVGLLVLLLIVLHLDILPLGQDLSSNQIQALLRLQISTHIQDYR